MDKADKIALTIFLSLLALVIVAFTLFAINADDDYWDQQFNGCYQHTVANRSLWHDDTTTKSLYCPRG